MKKILLSLILASMFITSVAPVYAQAGTVLPSTDTDIKGCNELLESVFADENIDDKIDKVLACAISTGRIELWMVPYFIMRLINILLGLAGLIAVMFLVVAGYQYIFGGLSEEKEKAKKTIMYAIGGLVLALLAWALVNLVQLALTS